VALSFDRYGASSQFVQLAASNAALAPRSSVSGTSGLRGLVAGAHQRDRLHNNVAAGLMRALAILSIASLRRISCSGSADNFEPESIIALE
jgi:hypothetical protein